MAGTTTSGSLGAETDEEGAGGGTIRTGAASTTGAAVEEDINCAAVGRFGFGLGAKASAALGLASFSFCFGLGCPFVALVEDSAAAGFGTDEVPLLGLALPSAFAADSAASDLAFSDVNVMPEKSDMAVVCRLAERVRYQWSLCVDVWT